MSKITPGSARGGGAVASYRAGADLSGLLWSMRLESLQTLAYYLQEVAADTALTPLDQVHCGVGRAAMQTQSSLDAEMFTTWGRKRVSQEREYMTRYAPARRGLRARGRGCFRSSSLFP